MRERKVGGVRILSEIDNLLPPLRSLSCVAVSQQLHYEGEKERTCTHQCSRKLFLCSNRDGRASDVDTPHRGNLDEMKRRPQSSLMKLVCPVGASIQRGC